MQKQKKIKIDFLLCDQNFFDLNKPRNCTAEVSIALSSADQYSTSYIFFPPSDWFFCTLLSNQAAGRLRLGTFSKGLGWAFWSGACSEGK